MREYRPSSVQVGVYYILVWSSGNSDRHETLLHRSVPRPAMMHDVPRPGAVIWLNQAVCGGNERGLWTDGSSNDVRLRVQHMVLDVLYRRYYRIDQIEYPITYYA